MDLKCLDKCKKLVSSLWAIKTRVPQNAKRTSMRTRYWSNPRTIPILVVSSSMYTN